VSGGAEVRLDHVTKSFEDGRVRALEDVSFTIAAGEYVALTGPSGCGKSTLLNLIGALDFADSGTVSVDDISLAALRRPWEYRAKTVGFVFQLHNLLATLTAIENVQIPMIGQQSPPHIRQQRALELLTEVGLAKRALAVPATLSGGERHRVAIARALANEPRLLLADEPTGALDAETADEVLDVLEAVRVRHGTTILLVTNDEEVAECADRILRLRNGVIRAVEPRRASAASPATPGSSPR